MAQTQIILVEDDNDLRETLVESLAIYGYPVTAAGTGLDFYQKLGRHTYDIAIIDLGLPDVDGYSLVEFVRRNTAAGVIVITSRDDISDRVRGYDTGADLYLTKPVNIRELAAAIASIASRRGAAAFGETPPNVERWHLNQDGWRLTDPDSQQYQLNQKEFQLIMAVAVGNGSPVSREVLLTNIYGSVDSATTHALEVMVSRLRLRFRDQCGRSLPLQTVVGSGYRFAGALAVV